MKPIVINQEGSSVVFIECENNAECIVVYNTLEQRHEEHINNYPNSRANHNITIIFSDGSRVNSYISNYAEPSAYVHSCASA